MSVICFHGIITPTLLNGGGHTDAGQIPGRGFTHRWMHVAVNVFMRVGTPCTFIATEDVDHAASIREGKIKYQMRLHAVPGHLEGVMPVEQAIQEIVEKQFRSSNEQNLWLHKLTQEGRMLIPQSTPPESKRCTCSINNLMARGCTCGSI